MNNKINKTIQESAMSSYQIVVIFICLIINMLDGFDVLVMAFTASSVSAEWGLDGAELGVLLSAGLFGMTAGSLTLAPLADKFGRRALILTCLVIVSVGMFFSALTQNMTQLALCRVFTGLGIGAMLASLNVIVAEYSSNKWRSLAVSFLQTGYPIGAVIGGSIAVFLIGQYGWRSVFLFGAVASFIMIPLVMWRLPESLEFLLVKRPSKALDKVNHLLACIKQPRIDELPQQLDVASAQNTGFKSLMSVANKRSTLLVWASYFLVMFSFYFVLSWTPKLLVVAGLSDQEGVSAGVLINLGGVVGGLLLGYLSSMFSLKKLTGIYMLSTAVFMIVFGLFSLSASLLLAVGIIIGFFLFGSIISLYALVPSVYHASIRATGMGWAIGIGRIGGILSPMVAGLLLDNNWQGFTLFIVFAVPLLISIYTVNAIVAQVAKPGDSPA